MLNLKCFFKNKFSSTYLQYFSNDGFRKMITKMGIFENLQKTFYNSQKSKLQSHHNNFFLTFFWKINFKSIRVKSACQFYQNICTILRKVRRKCCFGEFQRILEWKTVLAKFLREIHKAMSILIVPIEILQSIFNIIVFEL